MEDQKVQLTRRTLLGLGLKAEELRTMLCSDNRTKHIIVQSFSTDLDTAETIKRHLPKLEVPLDDVLSSKRESLRKISGLSAQDENVLLRLFGEVQAVLNVLDPLAPPSFDFEDELFGLSTSSSSSSSSSQQRFSKETLFNLKGFKMPSSHCRLFIENVISQEEYDEIRTFLQSCPQVKQDDYYQAERRMVLHIPTRFLANQALSAIRTYFSTKVPSVKTPLQQLPLSGTGYHLFKTHRRILDRLNTNLAGYGVRIYFSSDHQRAGFVPGADQLQRGPVTGKYVYDIPEGVDVGGLFNIVCGTIVSYANSKKPRTSAPERHSTSAPKNAPAFLQAQAQASVPTPVLTPFSVLPVASHPHGPQQCVLISDHGIQKIADKLIKNPKIIGHLPKTVSSRWDAISNQIILVGSREDHIKTWENEIKGWTYTSKIIEMERSQIQPVINQVMNRAKKLSVLLTKTTYKSPGSAKPEELAILLKGLASKVPIIEKEILKRKVDPIITETIELEIPIFNFVQMFCKAEIDAITSDTGITFQFESSLPGPDPQPSQFPAKQSRARKNPGERWFNQGVPGEKRKITFSGPLDKVAPAKEQLQRLIEPVAIEEYPPFPPLSSSSSSSSSSLSSSTKPDIPASQRATYRQAIELLKGSKGRIPFNGNINSASIKLVGHKKDLESFFKEINEIASFITTSQIDLSLNELKAWQDIIAADPENLKGVLKKINSKCTATINFKEGTSFIEIAGTPDNVELSKQIIRNMIGGNNIAYDPVSISILPEDSFLISRFFKDDLSSCLQSIPRSSVLLIPKENRIEFTCPLTEKDRAESFVRAFLANCRSQYRRDELTLDPKLHKILSKDQKILRKTSKKTGTFIQLKQFSRLMNHADLQADPSKRIELRAGNMILDTNKAIIIPNDESLSCTSIICQAVQGKAGSTFVSDSKAALHPGQVPRNGQCFQVQTPHSSTFDTVINLVLKNKDPKDPDPRATLQQIIQGALQFADQKGHQSVALPPIGPSQGYSVEDSLSALVAACSEILPSFTNLKVIKIFDMDETALTNLNQKILSLSGPPWKIATAKTISVSGFLAKQKQQMVSDRLSSLNATKSSLQIWNQWYWREDSHKISPADEKIAIIEGGQYFIPYDFDQNLQIEQASQNGLSEVLVVGDKKEIKNGFSYKVDLQRKVQINSTTGFERQIIFKSLDTPLQPPAVDLVSAFSVVDLDQSVEDDEDDEDDEVEDNSNSISLEPVEIRIIGKDSASIKAAKEMIEFKVQNSISERTVKAPLPITPDQKTKIEKMLGKAISFSITSQTVTIRASKNDADRLSLLITNYLVSKQVRKAYPPNWTSVPDPSNPFRATLVQVPAASPEFNDVQALFAQTLPSTPIIKLERIENRWLWDQYNHKAQAMRLKNPHIANNEMRLFHGTRGTDPSSIYNGQHGFDSNFCSSGMWGTGTYFAVNASYSKGYASNSPQGKQMFLCRVLVGDFAKIPPDGGLRMPPVKASGLARFKDERYDSVSGSTGGSVVFILYHDHHAYPEYFITFA